MPLIKHVPFELSAEQKARALYELLCFVRGEKTSCLCCWAGGVAYIALRRESGALYLLDEHGDYWTAFFDDIGLGAWEPPPVELDGSPRIAVERRKQLNGHVP
jgi:hypothetical protein